MILVAKGEEGRPMSDEDETTYGGVIWRGGLPTRSLHQNCAFCGADKPRWIHPLDAGKVQYRVFGKGHTLPTFWCVCSRCERLYERGLDEELIRVMRAELEWGQFSEAHVSECVEQPLAVFRGADLGAQVLPS